MSARATGALGVPRLPSVSRARKDAKVEACHSTDRRWHRDVCDSWQQIAGIVTQRCCMCWTMAQAVRVACQTYADIQSLANSLTKLGYSFEWVKEPADLAKADVCMTTMRADI